MLNYTKLKKIYPDGNISEVISYRQYTDITDRCNGKTENVQSNMDCAKNTTNYNIWKHQAHSI
jgi:hypothetical protein